MTGDGVARPHRGSKGGITWFADLIFAARPLLWIPAVALYGAGRAWGLRGRHHADFHWEPLGALLLILAAVHAANAWRDRDGDRWNAKGLPVVRGEVRGGALAALAAAALAAAAALTMESSAVERWFLLASLLLGVAYVTPPVELKRRAGWDLLSHGIGYGVIAFLLGAAGTGALQSAAGFARPLVASGSYALGILTTSLVTMLADRAGDERAGQVTTAVRLGCERSADGALLLAWATLAAALATLELVPALWAVVAVTALATGEKPRERSAASWNSLAVGLQLLFLALQAPWAPFPLAAAAIIGLATAGYNRWRWGVGYPLPAFGGAENRISEGRASR